MIQQRQSNPVSIPTGVVSALQRASSVTGMDFNFLLEQARVESSLNPTARASSSSAQGLFQFIDSTWMEMIEKHGAKYGLETAASNVEKDSRGQPVVNDPDRRQAILDLRYDPYISGLMASELAKENAAKLQQELGRDARPTELYMAHFLGAGGAVKFLRELKQNPGIEASYVLPAAARANRNVFFKAGEALSLNEVYARFENKFALTPPVIAAGPASPHYPVTQPANLPVDTASFAALTEKLAIQETLEMVAAAKENEVYEPLAYQTPMKSSMQTPGPTMFGLQLLQKLTRPEENNMLGNHIWRA
jgi:hypothetical protein